MKVKSTSIIWRIVAGAALAGAGGCASHKTPTTPLEVTTAPATTAAPASPHKNWMQQTADVTWDVVQAPVQLVKSIGPHKPAKVEDEAPPEPADAIIVQRGGGGYTAPTPATSQP